MKKLSLILGLSILIILALGYWFYPVKPKSTIEVNSTELALLKRQDSYLVRPIKTGPKEVKTPQDKAQQPSLHEGVAAWIGSYRLELAVYGLNKTKATYGVYLESSLSGRISPKNTELYLQVEEGKLLKMTPVRNGLFVVLGPLPKLPLKTLVVGEINNKKFSVNLTLENFRIHKITPHLD